MTRKQIQLNVGVFVVGVAVILLGLYWFVNGPVADKRSADNAERAALIQEDQQAILDYCIQPIPANVNTCRDLRDQLHALQEVQRTMSR